MSFESFLQKNNITEEELLEYAKENNIIIPSLINDMGDILSALEKAVKKDDIAANFDLEYIAWKDLMDDDRTLEEHVARYEVDDMDFQSYILLARDSIINGQMTQAVEYLSKSGEGTTKCFNEISKHITDVQYNHLVEKTEDEYPRMYR